MGADSLGVQIATEGFEAALSWYLYGFVGLALLTVVSPMIVLSIPLLVLLGPAAFFWWRGRFDTPRVGRVGRFYLIAVSFLLVATTVGPAIWYLMSTRSGAGEEVFWLFVIAATLLPFTGSTVAYSWRFRAAGPAGRRLRSVPTASSQQR